MTNDRQELQQTLLYHHLGALQGRPAEANKSVMIGCAKRRPINGSEEMGSSDPRVRWDARRRWCAESTVRERWCMTEGARRRAIKMNDSRSELRGCGRKGRKRKTITISRIGE